MVDLFSPFTLRGVTIRNRIGMSPMCQYSAYHGTVNDWHISHYGARAAGGCGLILVEAAAVEARGRITPHDLGLWAEDHLEGMGRLVSVIERSGAIPGIQIAHAGRKASVQRPWDGGKSLYGQDDGWQPIAPSAIPFGEGYPTPALMDDTMIADVLFGFSEAARRARAAGFKWLEIHAAHGYLLHSFLSPISNQRDDEYGGTFENRIRMLLKAVSVVRRAWGEAYPLAVRLSCTDWVEGGWTLEDSIALAHRLKAAGVDLVDCSSGGTARVKIQTAPGYQVPFAEAIRRESGIASAAVGLISEPHHANQIIQEERADLVLLGRELLRDSHWAQRASRELRGKAGDLLPPQYRYTLEP